MMAMTKNVAPTPRPADAPEPRLFFSAAWPDVVGNAVSDVVCDAEEGLDVLAEGVEVEGTLTVPVATPEVANADVGNNEKASPTSAVSTVEKSPLEGLAFV